MFLEQDLGQALPTRSLCLFGTVVSDSCVQTWPGPVTHRLIPPEDKTGSRPNESFWDL